jgi:HEAT repeat protein
MDWFCILTTGDDNQRLVAVQRLGELKDVGTVPALIQALDDSNEGVIATAAEALASIGDYSCIEALKAAYRKWKKICSGPSLHWDDRRLMVVYYALIKCLTDDQLIEVLKSGDDYERRVAAHFLGQRRVSSAEDSLTEALADCDSEVRSRASLALERIRDEKSSA